MAIYDLSPETERVVENLGYALLVAVMLSWLAFVVLDLARAIALPAVLGLGPMALSILVLLVVGYPVVSRLRAAIEGSVLARRMRDGPRDVGLDSEEAVTRAIAITAFVGGGAMMLCVLLLVSGLVPVWWT